MRRLLLFLLSTSFVGSSQTLEDFKCTKPVSVTATNPAVVTCPSPHGFNMRAMDQLLFTGIPSAGDTVTIGGVTYTFVSAVDNGTPRQVLIGQDAAGSSWNLRNAAADSGIGKGINYSSATMADPNFIAEGNYQSARLFWLYRTAGPTGIGISATTSHSSVMAFDTPQTRMQWSIYISGGAGSWTGIGTRKAPKFFFARYNDAKSFSLYLTTTASYDASGNGSACTGSCADSLYIQRASPGGNYYPAATGSWGTTGFAIDGYYQVILPGCSDTTHDLECSQSQTHPEQLITNASVYTTSISSFTISNGVGTFVLSSPYPYSSNRVSGKSNLTPGSPMFLRNFKDDPSLGFTHTITLLNDTTTGTSANHLVKYVPGTNTVRDLMWHDTNGANGGAIGVCVSGCGTSGSATIADAGMVTCQFDNNYTAGHWVSPTGYDNECHDWGSGFPTYTQQIGVVQSTGVAGTTANVWWNGLNRYYVVQSTNEACTPQVNPPGPGNCVGSGVTRITINVPGYPDGSYLSSTQLPGLTNYFSGARLTTANIGTYYQADPYIIYAATQAGGVYEQPIFQSLVKDQAGLNSATNNRLSLWIKWSVPQQQCLTNTAPISIGTYYTAPGGAAQQGQHRYVEGDPEIYSGWMRYLTNLVPSHDNQAASDGSYNYPNDPSYQGSAYGWGGKTHYIERWGTFYQDLSGVFCPGTRNMTGQTILMAPTTLESAVGEPEELVRSRFGQWAPRLFQAGDTPHAPTGGPGYSISWAVPHAGVTSTYEVRYSTAGSLKTAGFSSGKCQDGTTTCGPADRVSSDGVTDTVLYHSAPMGQQSNIWWAIRPISTSIASTGSAGNSTWMVMGVDPMWQTGDHVSISGVGTIPDQTSVPVTMQPRQTWTRFDPVPGPSAGITYPANSGGPIKVTLTSHGYMTGQVVHLWHNPGQAIDGQYTITVVDANNFTLNGTSYDASCPCSGGNVRVNTPASLISITSDNTPSPNTVCTVHLNVPHNLVPGWKFDVIGTTEASTTSPTLHLNSTDGTSPSTYTVASVPGSCAAGDVSCWTFQCPSATPQNGTWNTDAGINNGIMMIQSWPAVSVPVTATGTYSGAGTIASLENNRNFAEIQLFSYDGAPSPLSQRFGGANTSTASILLYQAPDSASCSITLSGTGAGTGSMTDNGGERSRLQVWSGLSAATTYTFLVSCAQGSYYASGSFTTMAAPSPSSVPVQVAATAPANAGAADNLVVDYGSTAGVQDGSANAACTPGTRCTASFTRNLDCMVWVRRRWCKNRATDPTCATSANEVARSTPEAITVR